MEAEAIGHGGGVREHTECTPPLASPTREMHAEVAEEVGRIRAYLKRAPQRRATPASCPRRELVHMLMPPYLLYVPPPKMGLAWRRTCCTTRSGSGWSTTQS